VKNSPEKYDIFNISFLVLIVCMDFNIFCPTAALPFEKYSILLIAAHIQVQINIIQPQREGDGRQALVVPPLDPTPATSLSEAPPTPV